MPIRAESHQPPRRALITGSGALHSWRSGDRDSQTSARAPSLVDGRWNIVIVGGDSEDDEDEQERDQHLDEAGPAVRHTLPGNGGPEVDPVTDQPNAAQVASAPRIAPRSWKPR